MTIPATLTIDPLPDLEARIEVVTDELAARLLAGDRHAAERLVDELRELAWQRRAAVIRGRRHRALGLVMRPGD
jgi:hypothetical protein